MLSIFDPAKLYLAFIANRKEIRMNTKCNSCLYIVTFLLLLSRVLAAIAITADELANTIEKMESAIVDISLEYEWYCDSPLTLEERLEYIADKELLIDVNIPRYKLSAARSLSNKDPNNPSSLLFDHLLLEESTTLMNKSGNVWDIVEKQSYNGKITKRLSTGGYHRSASNGTISNGVNSMHPINLTPIGFSVLRSCIRQPGDKSPLSAVLRDKEFINLDNSIEKFNGFSTIRADLLTHTNDPNTNKMVYLRIYFSVDHGYTPVRYEFMRGNNRVAFSFDVYSLEQVAEGLWFPSSGLISSPDNKRADGFQATSKILVNQGLTDEHFDIKFPPGTKVYDEIKNLKYVVKSH